MEQRLASELGRVPERDEVAKALGMTREEIHRLRDQTFRSVVLALESLVTDSSEEHVTLMDVLEDPKAVEPARELEGREMLAFLRDAVRLLPARQRLVIVGYFLEDKTSQELAVLLGVTESRISQMRTEALESMRRGIEAQYEPVEPQAQGRLAKRRAQYASAIGGACDWKVRLDHAPQLLPV